MANSNLTEREQRLLRRERIREEEERHRVGESAWKRIVDARRKEAERQQLIEEENILREEERRRKLAEKERRLEEEERRMILAEEERRRDIDRHKQTIRRQRQEIKEQRRPVQIRKSELEEDNSLFYATNQDVNPAEKKGKDSKREDEFEYESFLMEKSNVMTDADEDQTNQKSITGRLSSENKTRTHSFTSQFNRETCTPAPASEMKPHFMSVLDTEIAEMDRKLLELRTDTNTVLERNRQRMKNSAGDFSLTQEQKASTRRRLFPERDSSHELLNSNLDGQKDSCFETDTSRPFFEEDERGFYLTEKGNPGVWQPERFQRRERELQEKEDPEIWKEQRSNRRERELQAKEDSETWKEERFQRRERELQEKEDPESLKQERFQRRQGEPHEKRDHECWKQERLQRRERDLQEKEDILTSLDRELTERERRLDEQESLTDLDEQILRERERQIQNRISEMKRRHQDVEAREAKLYRLPIPEHDRETSIKGILESKKNREQTSYITHLESEEKECDDGTHLVSDKVKEEQKLDRSLLYPKFSPFSGEDPKPKTEASYEEWKYEVNCTRRAQIYTEELMAQAIRRSIRGHAKRVLLTLGVTANVECMLRRLESVFGNVSTGESILQEFYTAVQKQDESIANWGLRLEEILQKAVDKGHVKEEDKNEMLRQKFWRSLRSDRLKNATRVHFECLSSFEMLRSAVRAEEIEMKRTSNPQHQPIATQEKSEKGQSKEDSKLDSILKKLSVMEKQITDLQEERRPWGYRRRPFNRPNQNRQRPNTEETLPKTTSEDQKQSEN